MWRKAGFEEDVVCTTEQSKQAHLQGCIYRGRVTRGDPPNDDSQEGEEEKERPLTGRGQLSVPVVAKPEHLQLPAEGVDVGVRRHL